VVLALSQLLDAGLDTAFVARSLWVAVTLAVLSLIASFFHLGRPLRAWRAVMMWRTSWMSREVIVLPIFILLVSVWACLLTFSTRPGDVTPLLPVAVIVMSVLLWYCTAMIYACIRFIQEWAHALTIVNYTVIGLASGLVLAGALGVAFGQQQFASRVGAWAFAVTALAWLTRVLALRRNARLKPKSTLQSATGIKSTGPIVQKSMGMTAGSFNTRAFFHKASLAAFRRMKVIFQVFAFAVPLALVGLAVSDGWSGAWLLAVPVQLAGVLAERWFFFAQARHPQNLYYQVVS